MRKYRSKTFSYDRDFKTIDFRKRPELYEIGKGEQGVLLVEPYKSEILPYWKFKTEAAAKESSQKIFKLFLSYKKEKDFVGMDMARKFLQMGYTRARRYANHPSGKKYESNPHKEITKASKKAARAKKLPQDPTWATNEKAKAARVFYGTYLKARKDPLYQKMKKEWGKE